MGDTLDHTPKLQSLVKSISDGAMAFASLQLCGVLLPKPSKRAPGGFSMQMKMFCISTV